MTASPKHNPAGTARGYAPWMLGGDGETIDITQPRNTPISLRVIARSLGSIVRWNGHTSTGGALLAPYTVAAHSLHVYQQLAPLGELPARLGLLHDAHEAYLGDIPTPLKIAIGGRLRALDAAWAKRVRAVFGVLSAAVHFADELAEADLRALATEWDQLMPGQPPRSLPAPDKAWDCTAANRDAGEAFLARARSLGAPEVSR